MLKSLILGLKLNNMNKKEEELDYFGLSVVSEKRLKRKTVLQDRLDDNRHASNVINASLFLSESLANSEIPIHNMSKERMRAWLRAFRDAGHELTQLSTYKIELKKEAKIKKNGNI